MIGIPLVFQIFMMLTMFSDLDTDSNPDHKKIIGIFQFFPVIMILYISVFFSWFWSIGIGLQNKVPASIKMKIKKFKIFFFIPLIYITLLSIGMGISFSGYSFSNNFFPNNLGLMLPLIILPLHLFSMFCMFYMLYFCSKTIKTVELQKEVSFGEFIGEFFSLWFYPIGIWFIQPKINKLAKKIEEIQDIGKNDNI
ncbi:hypothetical protein [Algibacter marinivivus]|nr:hypothetical protein [Algibacter marinivivus]